VLYAFYFHDLEPSNNYKLSDLMIPYSRYDKSKQVRVLVVRQCRMHGALATRGWAASCVLTPLSILQHTWNIGERVRCVFADNKTWWWARITETSYVGPRPNRQQRAVAVRKLLMHKGQVSNANR
jgi:hypothetical protein